MTDQGYPQPALIWETVYSEGRQNNRFPWDAVVSFLATAQKYLNRGRLRVLEVGCGTGANLAAAQELGCEVYGLDISPTAVDTATRRLGSEADGVIRVGDFSQLPWNDDSFDIVIDRAALTTSSPTAIRKSLQEIHRCLAPDSLFFFNPYSTGHGSSRFAGTTDFEGLLHVRQAPSGYLADLGDVTFVDRSALRLLLPHDDWEILSAREVSSVEFDSSDWRNKVDVVEAELRVIAKKRVSAS